MGVRERRPGEAYAPERTRTRRQSGEQWGELPLPTGTAAASGNRALPANAGNRWKISWPSLQVDTERGFGCLARVAEPAFAIVADSVSMPLCAPHDQPVRCLPGMISRAVRAHRERAHIKKVENGIVF